MKYVIAAVGGLVVGALLNVVSERLPERVGRRDRSDADVPGDVPAEAPPVVERPPGSPPAWRRAAVALSAGALAVLTVLTRHGAHDVALGLTLGAVLIPVSVIDLEHRLIPNLITGPAAVAAIVIGAATHPGGLPAQLIGGAAAFAFMLVFALAYPRGLGMGDVKLAGVLGLFLGSSVAVAIVVGICTSAVLGLGIIVARGAREGRKTGIPLGPFLALGGVVGILAGPHIVHWYVHSVVK